MRKVRILSQADLDGLLREGEKLTVVDVREQDEFAHSGMQGSICVPLTELSGWLASASFDEPIVFVCEVGQRSLQAANFAASVGFTSISSLQNGVSNQSDG
jgi:rhodanese-related sulfurtransferase